MKKGLLYWYQIYNIYTDVKNTSLIYKSYWVINTFFNIKSVLLVQKTMVHSCTSRENQQPAASTCN